MSEEIDKDAKFVNPLTAVEQDEAELELQIMVCERFAEELITKIEAHVATEQDESKRNWRMAQMLHSIGTIITAPALAIARLNLTEDEYTDFRARVYQGTDAGCDEIYEAALAEVDTPSQEQD